MTINADDETLGPGDNAENSQEQVRSPNSHQEVTRVAPAALRGHTRSGTRLHPLRLPALSGSSGGDPRRVEGAASAEVPWAVL